METGGKTNDREPVELAGDRPEPQGTPDVEDSKDVPDYLSFNLQHPDRPAGDPSPSQPHMQTQPVAVQRANDLMRLAIIFAFLIGSALLFAVLLAILL